DPHQSNEYKRAGVTAIDRAGLTGRHTLLETFDYLALPNLLAATQSVDLAFVDGWHTFDYTLLDFWYLDKMLRVGGIIGFDDCHFAAVHKVIAFINTHRQYEEVSV